MPFCVAQSVNGAYRATTASPEPDELGNGLVVVLVLGGVTVELMEEVALTAGVSVDMVDVVELVEGGDGVGVAELVEGGDGVDAVLCEGVDVSGEEIPMRHKIEECQ